MFVYQSGQGTQAIEPIGTPEERKAPLRWLEPGDEQNPFARRVLDCRSITRGSVAAIKERDAFDRYVALRRDDGEVLRDVMPKSPRRIRCNLAYPLPPDADGLQSGRLFSSGRLEYKWDGFHLGGGSIVLRRSWSGEVLYRIQTRVEPGRLVASEIIAAGDRAVSESWEIAAVDFLLKTYLLKLPAPHPLVSEPGADERTLAKLASSYFGADACFGYIV